MSIRITTSSGISHKQIFSLFTEKSWAEKQNQFPPNTQHFFHGKKEEVFVINQEDGTQYLIGIGNDYKKAELQQIANKFSNDFRKNIQAVSTFLDSEVLDFQEIKSFIKGLFLGTYQYPFKKEHPFWENDFEISLPHLSREECEEITLETHAICEGQFACMEWLNKPNNFKKVKDISDFFKEISEKYQLKRTVFNRKEAEEKGLGAFLAVNQGSSMDCAFTILEYNGGKPDAKKIGLVGKCVLFDTGGISLKNATNMHYMKSDLGGATGIMGALIAAAELKLPINLVAIFPITDNAIGSKAYVPSDVVKAYNGKTIEILNTDAEGRLTLLDGLAYMVENYKTDVLIDMATLTGSVVRMFGETCGALFSNHEDLKTQLIKSGKNTQQKLWNLPLWEIWEEDIKSNVADYKNISMNPTGDAIVAATLLKQFIGNHTCWAHIDMAAMVYGRVNYSKEKAATGYGVQLLLDFFENFK